MGEYESRHPELTSGFCVIDTGFQILTANQALYLYIGISSSYYITDIIHPIDLDDFIDLANNMYPGQEKKMVLRLKRNDNSYRWMSVSIRRCKIQADVSTCMEYLELHLADVFALESQATEAASVLNTMMELNASSYDVFFLYNYEMQDIQVNFFHEQKISSAFRIPIAKCMEIFTEKHHIDESSEAFRKFKTDLQKGTANQTYSMTIHIPDEYGASSPDQQIQISCRTTYHGESASFCIGSARYESGLPAHARLNSMQSIANSRILTQHEMREYCKHALAYNPHRHMTLITIEIDPISGLTQEYGEDIFARLTPLITNDIQMFVRTTGAVCHLHGPSYLCIIKDLGEEARLRAMIEAMRSSITWSIQKQYPGLLLTFSIGIVRFPQNGSDFHLLLKKMNRALLIAEEKGGNRFIIYKEYLHGELS